jgi:demethylmenaquinone methyltransferase / 2-methoxy-6-polyprenyl-1,4-benzoquinol methylase
MFEEISPSYDRLNAVLSLGLDRGWRRWAVRGLRASPAGPWCDLASGTGDLALEMLAVGRPVVRADLSSALLRRAEGKAGRGAQGWPGVACEMDQLPFRAGSLAAVGQGFALRHSRCPESLFCELHRVLRPGGRIALLDMRYPADGLFGPIYRCYFRSVLPRLAALLGGDRDAYEMMVASVRALPPETEILRAATAAGFEGVRSERGLFGAVRLIVGEKPTGSP